MKRFDGKALWLVVPCAIPLLVLVWPSFKTAMFPVYKPLVDEVHFARTSQKSSDPDDRCYVATIYLNHTGPRPDWWGKLDGFTESREFPNGRYETSHALDMKELVNPHFVDARGKKFPWYGYGADFGLYDVASQRYVVHCDSCVTKDFVVKGSRLVADLKTKSDTLKVDQPLKLSPPLFK